MWPWKRKPKINVKETKAKPKVNEMLEVLLLHKQMVEFVEEAGKLEPALRFLIEKYIPKTEELFGHGYFYRNRLISQDLLYESSDVTIRLEDLVVGGKALSWALVQFKDGESKRYILNAVTKEVAENITHLMATGKDFFVRYAATCGKVEINPTTNFLDKFELVAEARNDPLFPSLKEFRYVFANGVVYDSGEIILPKNIKEIDLDKSVEKIRIHLDAVQEYRNFKHQVKRSYGNLIDLETLLDRVNLTIDVSPILLTKEEVKIILQEKYAEAILRLTLQKIKILKVTDLSTSKTEALFVTFYSVSESGFYAELTSGSVLQRSNVEVEEIAYQGIKLC